VLIINQNQYINDIQISFNSLISKNIILEGYELVKFGLDTFKFHYIKNDEFKGLIKQKYIFSNFDKQSENQNKSLCTPDIINYFEKVPGEEKLVEYLQNMASLYDELSKENKIEKNSELVIDNCIKIINGNIKYIKKRNKFLSDHCFTTVFSDEILEDCEMNLKTLEQMKKNNFFDFNPHNLCQNKIESFFSETKQKQSSYTSLDYHIIEQKMLCEIIKINDQNNPFTMNKGVLYLIILGKTYSHYNVIKDEISKKIETVPLKKKIVEQKKFNYSNDELKFATNFIEDHQYHNMKTIRQTFHKTGYIDKNLKEIMDEFKLDSYVVKSYENKQEEPKSISVDVINNTTKTISIIQNRTPNQCLYLNCKKLNPTSGISCTNKMCSKHCKINESNFCKRHHKK
jgi:hypothetical protein